MRKPNLFWGSAIILLGVILLLNTLGYLQANIGSLFWATALIFLGIWFLLGPKLLNKEAPGETRKVQVALDGASSGYVRIRHGAGKLHIHALDDPNLLLAGDLSGDVDMKVERDGDNITAKLRPERFVFVPFFYQPSGLTWDLGINPNIPLRIKMDTGASDSHFDFSGLMLSELKLSTGASATEVIMPSSAGNTTGKIDMGAASLKMRIPEGVGASIKVDGGVLGVQINAERFPRAGNLYQSVDFANSANRLELEINAGAGSIEVY
jgi:hypothetical protein